MAKLRLMSHHGDICLAEWALGSSTSCEAAEELFTRERSRGCLAFRIDGPGRNAAIESFERTAAEILLVPPVQGG